MCANEMLELTKFGDVASEKGERECAGKKVGGLGGWNGSHEMQFNKKKHQDTHVGNKKNFCQDVTSLVAVDRDEGMALGHQRNSRKVPKMHQVQYFNRDGKMNLNWSSAGRHLVG